jgi:hypothetical protein
MSDSHQNLSRFLEAAHQYLKTAPSSTKLELELRAALNIADGFSFEESRENLINKIANLHNQIADNKDVSEYINPLLLAQKQLEDSPTGDSPYWVESMKMLSSRIQYSLKTELKERRKRTIHLLEVVLTPIYSNQGPLNSFELVVIEELKRWGNFTPHLNERDAIVHLLQSTITFLRNQMINDSDSVESEFSIFISSLAMVDTLRSQK